MPPKNSVAAVVVVAVVAVVAVGVTVVVAAVRFNYSNHTVTACV